MTTVSSSVAERSRKYLQACMQSISRVGQNSIAEQLGVSAPTVSRFVSDDLERACQVIAAAGLKIVPAEMRCYPQDQIDAILTLARGRLNQTVSAEQLSFD